MKEVSPFEGSSKVPSCGVKGSNRSYADAVGSNREYRHNAQKQAKSFISYCRCACTFQKRENSDIEVFLDKKH